VLAALPGSPIARLVLNDIGPDVPTLASSKVGMRVAMMPSSFKTLDHAETYFRSAFAACGPMTDEHWRDFVFHSLRFDESREHFISRMDPKVATAFNWLWYYQIPLWTYFRKIGAPVMSIRGETSDFVPKSLVRDMRKALPGLETLEVQGAGHMPMLMSADEISAVASFLKI
jgi:pimeloyl-ACP methyl ester carboxylesterase